nr:hypothetical protein CFP56_23872 [Quercus suber]
MDCFNDFCIACDKESHNGGAYCSQTCRLADLERASAADAASPSSIKSRSYSSSGSSHRQSPTYNPPSRSMDQTRLPAPERLSRNELKRSSRVITAPSIKSSNRNDDPEYRYTYTSRTFTLHHDPSELATLKIYESSTVPSVRPDLHGADQMQSPAGPIGVLCRSAQDVQGNFMKGVELGVGSMVRIFVFYGRRRRKSPTRGGPPPISRPIGVRLRGHALSWPAPAPSSRRIVLPAASDVRADEPGTARSQSGNGLQTQTRATQSSTRPSPTFAGARARRSSESGDGGTRDKGRSTDSHQHTVPSHHWTLAAEPPPERNVSCSGPSVTLDPTLCGARAICARLCSTSVQRSPSLTKVAPCVSAVCTSRGVGASGPDAVSMQVLTLNWREGSRRGGEGVDDRTLSQTVPIHDTGFWLHGARIEGQWPMAKSATNRDELVGKRCIAILQQRSSAGMDAATSPLPATKPTSILTRQRLSSPQHAHLLSARLAYTQDDTIVSRVEANFRRAKLAGSSLGHCGERVLQQLLEV